MNLKEALDKAPVVSYNDDPPPTALVGPVQNPASEQTALIQLATKQIMDGEVMDEEEWETEQYEDDLEQAVEFVVRSKEIFKFYCDWSKSKGMISIRDRIQMLKLVKDMEKWIDSLELASDIPPNDPAYKEEEKPTTKCPKCKQLLLVDREMMAVYCPATQTNDWQGHYFEGLPEHQSGLEFEPGTPDNMVKLAEKITEQLGGV